MIKIGLTQRVISLPEVQETRDSLDQRWANLLSDLGITPIPIPNMIGNVDDYIDRLELDGVILTGGGDILEYAAEGAATPERDRVEHALIDYCDSQRKPLLGVCRGLQALVNHYDGKLTPIQDHVAARHEIEFIESLSITAEQPRTVNSFHDFGVLKSDLPVNLNLVAQASDSTVEAVVDSTGRMVGIMWHPEREQTPVEWDRALLHKLFVEKR